MVDQDVHGVGITSIPLGTESIPLEDCNVILGLYNGNKYKKLTRAAKVYMDVRDGCNNGLRGQDLDDKVVAKVKFDTSMLLKGCPDISFWVDINKVREADTGGKEQPKLEDLLQAHPQLRFKLLDSKVKGEKVKVFFVQDSDNDFYLRRDLYHNAGSRPGKPGRPTEQGVEPPPKKPKPTPAPLIALPCGACPCCTATDNWGIFEPVEEEDKDDSAGAYNLDSEVVSGAQVVRGFAANRMNAADIDVYMMGSSLHGTESCPDLAFFATSSSLPNTQTFFHAHTCCPITGKQMIDPVVNPMTGESYERNETVGADKILSYYPNRALKGYIDSLSDGDKDTQQRITGNLEFFFCPITKDLMRDPVIDYEGNSYERTAIAYWIRRNGTSPINKSQLNFSQLCDNKTLFAVLMEVTQHSSLATADVQCWRNDVSNFPLNNEFVDVEAPGQREDLVLSMDDMRNILLVFKELEGSRNRGSPVLSRMCNYIGHNLIANPSSQPPQLNSRQEGPWGPKKTYIICACCSLPIALGALAVSLLNSWHGIWPLLSAFAIVIASIGIFILRKY